MSLQPIDSGTVTITITMEQYETLIFALGVAVGAAMVPDMGGEAVARSFLKLASAINESKAK